MPRTDVQLLIATHKGSEQAARELWNRHAGSMLALARAILRDTGAADDAVQQVFCRLLMLDRRTLAQVSDVRAWLAQLVRREALNQVRGQRRRASRERERERGRLQDGAMHADVSGATAMVGDSDLHQAVERLPRRLREIIVLKHVCGLTFDQIGLALGLSRNTAAGRHRQALTVLHTALGECDRRAAAEEVGHA